MSDEYSIDHAFKTGKLNEVGFWHEQARLESAYRRVATLEDTIRRLRVQLDLDIAQGKESA